MNYITQIEEKLELSRFNKCKITQTISDKLKTRPEHVSLAFLSLLSVFFGLTCIGNLILLIFFGFLFPAYKTLQCVELEDAKENKKWLVYWVTAGFAVILKKLCCRVLSFFPFKNLILTLALCSVYCSIVNGYVMVYDHAFKPALKICNDFARKYCDSCKEDVRDKAARTKSD